MHACANFKFHVTGKQVDKDKLADFLSDRLEDDIVCEDDVIEVEETYECVWLDNIEELAVEIVGLVPDLRFVLSGVIDTSESAGEYMDFCIKYDGKKLTTQSSCWYLVVDVMSYDSYEDFCEEYDNGFSEEDYYKGIANDGEFFVLDSGSGDVVMKVPLSEPVEIELD